MAFMPYHHFMAPSPTQGSTRNSPLASSRSPSPANVGQHRVTIDVEATDEESRQRMYYTDEEDIRLIEIDAGISNMKDFQERLSTQKVEAAKLTYMTAKENKEAKLLENKSKSKEHRSKMMDKFSEMLNVDTSKMEPWAKETHVRAVTALGDELYGRDGTA